MKKHTETLKFRTMWLRNTIKVIRTSSHNYHLDTQKQLAKMIAAK